jgi:excisionase family DNA binding protein
MADIHEFPDVPGYVSIKQAADMLGITDKRVYRYIDLGRLPAFKSGGVFLLAVEDVQHFKLNPPGRTRSVAPSWRVYNSRSRVLATEILVSVRAGQQEKLREKLAEIQKANRHSLAGTIARYVVKGDSQLTTVRFFLVWKDTEMPKESERKQSLKALEEELTEFLEWETAHYSTNEAIIYT